MTLLNAFYILSSAFFILLIIAVNIGKKTKKKEDALKEILLEDNSLDIKKINNFDSILPGLMKENYKSFEIKLKALISESIEDLNKKNIFLEKNKLLIEKINNFDSLLPGLLKEKYESFEKQMNIMLSKASMIEKHGLEIFNKLTNQEYFIGMTIEQLTDFKGKPTKIDTEITKTKTKKIYIYGNKSSGDVFVFENETLASFKDR